MEETAKDIYKHYRGKRVFYKNVLSGYVAGYTENYVIICFTDFTGCVKSFSSFIVFDSCIPDSELPKGLYYSYRFAKPKNIFFEKNAYKDDEFDYVNTDHWNSSME